MKIVEPYAKLINEKDPIKLVETVGRLCYKSENKITDNSCYKFVNMLISHKHYAMLEHGHVHFLLTTHNNKEFPSELSQIPYIIWTEVQNDIYEHQKSDDRLFIVTVSLSHLFKNYDDVDFPILNEMLYLFLEKYEELKYEIHVEFTYEINIALGDESILHLLSAPDAEKHTFYTMKFVCDRGVSHELVRHRCSVAQESTRYCNYSKDKFDNQISVIKPVNIIEGTTVYENWYHLCSSAESTYLSMLNDVNPQDARAILPTSLKTEVILTMNLEQWQHFFDVRFYGLTGTPHPDMLVVANKAIRQFEIMQVYM